MFNRNRTLRVRRGSSARAAASALSTVLPSLVPMRLSWPRRLALVVLVPVAVVAAMTLNLPALETLTVDWRFGRRGARASDGEVVVVAIDEHTLRELGVRWPFSREILARLIDRLAQDGAKAIGLDILLA